ncbi:hypothetical protein BT93_J0036 [Corymbia citriodora subsp. variegata]|nr:hypothetical protein BT93_J0036 [Corymbia citriodora subsp. variegata]
MVGKEESNVNPLAPCHISTARKTFWRSASWSSSRTAQQNPGEEGNNCSDSNGNGPDSFGQNRRFPAPLTPRSQHNCKARSCLPPLQPLSITRRSLDEWPKAGSDDVGEWPQPPTPSGNRGGERLKLDMSAIQRNPDKNGGLVKREKIAFFDKECSKVAEHIYLGGDAVAKDRDILKRNGITHVLNCVGFVCPEYFKADFVYRTLWLQDSPSEDITSILYDVFDYFEDVREQHGRVFVHCCQGVSRSTSLVIAYLMWREGQSFDDAFQFVKAARGIADPNMGFACQLLQCQKRVHAFPLSPSSLLRMYRIVPHSSYDPLHLVPKMLTDPSPAALDSRGAFIVQVPSSIYMWIGRECESIMERDARGAVCQIMRYERVHGPVVMIREGEEPSYFWDVFSNLLPLMDKSGNGVSGKELIARKTFSGRRKVDLYDVDFEIFKKAIKGGVVPPFASSENEHETHLPARESSWSVLRRKFAPSNMKDFVSAPKITLSRVFSDSMMVVHSPVNCSPASSTSSSSSSSSPPYLSPDSLSSDSSTSSTYFSESSLDSPSTASCSLPVSSTLSNFSNLSLHRSITISQPMSQNQDYIDINFPSRPHPLSVSSPVKKVCPSLAERRGSASRTLKLPVGKDKVTQVPSIAVPPQENGVWANGNTCTSLEPGPDRENVVETGDSMKTRERHLAPISKFQKPCPVVSDLSSNKVAGIRAQSCLGRSGELEEVGVPSVSREIDQSVVECNGKVRPLIFCWPSLEEVAAFGRSDLNSGAVFAIYCPATFLKQSKEGILYFWLGRSFNCNESKIPVKQSRDLGDVEKIDWNQVAHDFLLEKGLLKETKIEILIEDQEPEEFLAIMRLIRNSELQKGPSNPVA